MAALVRYAVDKTFEDELDGIAASRALAEHLQDPSGSMTLDEFLKVRGIELPNRPDADSHPRSKAASG